MAGTVAASGTETAAAALRVARACVASGVKRLLFVNGHVGNAAAAVDRVRRIPAGVSRRTHRRHAVVGADPRNRRGTQPADAVDWHANAAETSIMVMALRPELVDTDALAGADDPDRTAGTVFRYALAHVSTNGVTGLPVAGLGGVRGRVVARRGRRGHGAWFDARTANKPR